MQPRIARRASPTSRRSPAWTSAALAHPVRRLALVGDADLEVRVAQQPPHHRGPDRAGAARDQDAAHVAAEQALSRPLAGEADDEARVVAQVAPPQPAGLVREPERPLEPEPLHPARGLRDQAAVEVERGADADQHAARSRAVIRAIHFSCFGTPMPTHTISAPERWMSAATASSSSRVSVAERRRVAADDLQPGMAQPQVARELDERALAATAVEVHAAAGRAGARAGAVHQVGPVYAVGRSVAEQVQRPDQRLAVGHREVGAEHRGAQLGIVLRGHHGVRRGHADVAAAAGRHRLSIQSSASLVVGQRERDAEHARPSVARPAASATDRGGEGPRPVHPSRAFYEEPL